jgi:phosphoserine phosphatase
MLLNSTYRLVVIHSLDLGSSLTPWDSMSLSQALGLPNPQKFSWGRYEFDSWLIDADQVALCRSVLLQFAQEKTSDWLLLPESVFLAPKSLFVFDMDSTLIEMEVIDELARKIGQFEAVSSITEQAMRGELDFSTSFTARMLLLKGLTEADLESVASLLKLNPHVDTLTQALNAYQIYTLIVSGGFDYFANRLKSRLYMQQAIANGLVFLPDEQGVLRVTGEVAYPIVDVKFKQQALQSVQKQKGLAASSVVAIGDGANDLLMLQAAGVGIAYRAKAVLQAQADGVLNWADFDVLIPLLLDQKAIFFI